MKIDNNNLNESNKDCVSDDLLKFVQTKAFVSNSSNLENGIMDKNTTFNKNISDDKEQKNKAAKVNSNEGVRQQEIAATKDLPQNNSSESNKATAYKDFLNDMTRFMQSVCQRLKLKAEESNQLINELQLFIISSIEKNEKIEDEQKKLLCLHLKKIQGSDFKNKMFLIKRAAAWLSLNNLDTNEGYLNFLYKMMELGSMVSEDQGVKNEQNIAILSKEEAKRQRNILTSDDKFKQALTNKMHPLHKDALNKLRNLNSIIIT